MNRGYIFLTLEKVAIIMSTYNGEKFLREQIDSILLQENVDIRLFIRDDGSKDNTTKIINEYSKENDNVIFWNKDCILNLGIRDSFLSLLKDVYEKYADIEYFAFADQDDVWNPKKLSTAIKKIAENKDRPTLYYSNKTFVDADLNLIFEENIKYYGDFYEVLWTSLASGCTMVMNRAVVQLSVRIFPEYAGYIHDSWIYRLSKLCNVNIVFDNKSYILYRQHGDNAFGGNFLRPVKPEKLLPFLTSKGHGFQQQVEEIARLNSEYIMPENRKYIDWVLTYDKRFSSLWHLATAKEMRERGIKLYLIWVLKLLLKKI